jgi:hypothetical protein
MANELRDRLNRERNAPRNLSGNGRKKKVSGHGEGKWETPDSLKRYRLRRNKARKGARTSRATNR